MQLEDNFDFLAPDDIRIRGTRIGIESVLYEYVHREQSAERSAGSYPTLTLEQVYATILYYLHNREEMDAYLRSWLEWSNQVRQVQDREPPPVVAKLKNRKAELHDALAGT